MENEQQAEGCQYQLARARSALLPNYAWTHTKEAIVGNCVNKASPLKHTLVT